VIAVDALEGGYGESPVLRGVTLYATRGEIFAILGKNGMGKTTLLKTVMGLLRARSGRVEILGQEVTGWPAFRITRLGVSYVPQEKSIFQDLTVEENLRLALRERDGFDARLGAVARWFPVLAARRRQRAGTLSRAASRRCSSSAGRSSRGPGCCSWTRSPRGSSRP
jgi:ABC-type branched-subunit amino acid transport system ATPase component